MFQKKDKNHLATVVVFLLSTLSNVVSRIDPADIMEICYADRHIHELQKTLAVRNIKIVNKKLSLVDLFPDRKSLCRDVIDHSHRDKRQNQNIFMETKLSSFFKSYLRHYSIQRATFFIHKDFLTGPDGVQSLKQVLRNDCPGCVAIVIREGFPVALPVVDEGSNVAYIVMSGAETLYRQADSSTIGKALRFGKWLIRSEVPPLLFKDNSYPRFDSHVQTFEFFNGGEIIVLNEVYRVREGYPLTVDSVGAWNSKLGLLMTEVPLWERRNNLQGLVFKATIIHSPPWTTAIQFFNGTVQPGGPQYDLWSGLEVSLNFTTDFKLSKDGIFGGLQSDGTYNGLIGNLQRREDDVAINGLSILDDRVKAADHTTPLGDFEISIYYKTSTTSKELDWTTFLNPFATGIWISTLVLFVICSMMYFITVGLYLKDKKQHKFDLWISFMTIMHGFTNQGNPTEPEKYSSRLIFLSSFLFSILLWANYSAALFSFLTTFIETPPFTNLPSMYHKTHYSLGTLKDTSYDTFLKNGGPVLSKIYETRLIPATSWQGLIDDTKHLSLVAYLGPTITLEGFARKTCSYKKIPTWSMGQLFSFFLQKDMPYKDLINYQIGKMQESGQLHRAKTKWMNAAPPSSCAPGGTAPLTMEKLVLLFTFLFVMAILCLLLLACEKLYRETVMLGLMQEI